MGPQIPVAIQAELDKLRNRIEIVNGIALAGPTFVLDESSAIYTTPAPNVFRTWDTLYAAANKVAGPRLVEVVEIGHLTGTANIDEMFFYGTTPASADSANPGILLLQPGASISFNTVYLSHMVMAQNGGATAPLVLTGGVDVQMFLRDQSQIAGSATAPFASLVGSTLTIDGQDQSSVGDNTNVAIQTDINSELAFSGVANSQVLQKAVGGNGAFIEKLDDSSPFSNQANFTGVRTIIQLSNFPYAASISQSVLQSIPTGALTALTLTNHDYNVGGKETNFAPWTANANRLTAPITGVYRFNGTCGFPSLPAGGATAQIAITVNGLVSRLKNYQVSNAANPFTMDIQTQLQLNVGDQVGLSVEWAGAAGSANTDVTAGITPQLQGMLVR